MQMKAGKGKRKLNSKKSKTIIRKNLSQLMSGSVAIKQLMTLWHRLDDPQVGGEINTILIRDRMLTLLQTAAGNHHILLCSPPERFSSTTFIRLSRVVDQLGISVRKLELRIGQEDPITGKRNLVAGLNIVVHPGGNDLFFAEKYHEPLRKHLEKLVCHHTFIATYWHPDARTFNDDAWTIRLITKSVAFPSKRYFAVQIAGN